MKSEDRISVPRVRIAVLGNPNVGKSALTVRYLTRRYIGEYRSQTDLLYRQTVTLLTSEDPGPTSTNFQGDQHNHNRGQHQPTIALDVEIVDISSDNEDSCNSNGDRCNSCRDVTEAAAAVNRDGSCHGNEEEFQFPVDQVQWADACLIVYSITDAKSLRYAASALAKLGQLGQGGPSAALVGNKADLEHLREVPESEGVLLSQKHSVPFCEVSVADNSPQLYKIFDKLLLETLGNFGNSSGTTSNKRNANCCQNKLRKFSVSKMLGTLIGATNVLKNQQYLIGNNGFGTRNNSLNGLNGNLHGFNTGSGTVVACNKSELYKSRILKRRQNFTAAASL